MSLRMKRKDRKDSERMTRNDEQGSPLSVDTKLVPWCVGGMAILAVLWTALAAWNEIAYGDHANWTLACEAIAGKVFFALPGIVLVPIVIAAGGKLYTKLGKDFWRMINYNFPLIGGKVIERRISEWKNAGRAEGIDEGVVKGRAEGRAEERAAWSTWNSRRVEAERDGIPFHEPPPDDGPR